MAASTNEVGFHAGSAPANARYPLYSWVGWSNVSKVPLLKETTRTVTGHIKLGIEPGTLRLPG